MPARRETSDADKACVEVIVRGMGADEAQGGLHVVNLCGKLGVATGAVIDADDGETSVDQRFPYRHVGHRLHVVGKPSTAVDDHDYLVGFLPGLGEIDVHPMGLEVVAGIVDVTILGVGLGHLKASETLGLCIDDKRKEQH